MTSATEPAVVTALPTSSLAREVLRVVQKAEPVPVFNHSVRSYLFARLVAIDLGLRADRDYDDDLLFAACLMHDIGVAEDSPHEQRFEVEGADRAAQFLTANGVGAGAVDQVWQAIALHTSPGIAERRGALCVLVREGVAVDFGGPLGAHYVDRLSAEVASAVHEAFPRLDMIRSLTDAIVAHANTNPRNAPRYSIPGEFLRERTEFGSTRLEHASRSSRWDRQAR